MQNYHDNPQKNNVRHSLKSSYFQFYRQLDMALVVFRTYGQISKDIEDKIKKSFSDACVDYDSIPTIAYAKKGTVAKYINI